MKRNRNVTILLFLFFSLYICRSQEIIPYPNHYEQKEGKLSIPKVVTISAESGEFNSLIPGFVGTLRNFSVRAKETRKKGWIQLVRNAACYNPEEYRLTISPEGIIVEAGCANG
ncbi:MAG TPA: hypothetical protein GXX42_10540, partial [Petrimonas sp.]|uniref:glycoside hydrolase family 20 zincin-like fold domain-containing protein n=1 Tax=Petrimonas sp. TaxID=2023866 RepID=UPI0017550BB3|nr:hypothetical protein [Petrimonas sp.]